MNRIVLLTALAMALTAGCKKKPKDVPPDSAPPPAPSASGGGGGGGGGVLTVGGGGGGGGGAVQAVRGAARRTQALNEMKTLGQVIEQMRDPFGKMPTKDQIVAGLKGYPQLLTAVTEGSFILTGTTDGGGLWAYEVEADTKPGIALIGGTATRSTPEDLQQYFRKN